MLFNISEALHLVSRVFQQKPFLIVGLRSNLDGGVIHEVADENWEEIEIFARKHAIQQDGCMIDYFGWKGHTYSTFLTLQCNSCRLCTGNIWELEAIPDFAVGRNKWVCPSDARDFSLLFLTGQLAPT